MTDKGIATSLVAPAALRWLAGTVAVLLIISACSDASVDSGRPADGGRTPTPGGDIEFAEGLAVTVAASDLALGPNRIAINVQRTDRTRVDDAAESLKLTYESADAPAESGVKEAQLTWRPWPVQSGAYTAMLTFDAPGMWRLRVSHDTEDLIPGIVKVFVHEVSSTPAKGEAPPRLPSRVGSTPAELALITSDPGPDPDLYKADLAEAIGSGQPVAVAFSTPAFCKSATCGPQVDVLSELEDEYGAQAHFIHVEIFDNPAEVLQSGDLSIARESPLVEAWGLPSEPWTFVINGDGKVVAKFEGFATRAELEEALQDVLGI